MNDIRKCVIFNISLEHDKYHYQMMRQDHWLYIYATRQYPTTRCKKVTSVRELKKVRPYNHKALHQC